MIGWICIFLMISSSLTTEGLRRRFPRPIILRRLHEDQCGSVVRIDSLDSEVRRVRVRQRRHAGLRLPICAQLTDDQLLKKLKDIGGYDPIDVAINITEARKFKDPRTFEKEKMSLLEKLFKRTDDFKDDARAVRKLVKRRSVVESCWLKGSYVDGSGNKRVHLCSECRVMTHLAEDEMPQYINEVVCAHNLSEHSGQAAHDDQCYASAGLCAQKVLQFPVMKRSGYVRDPDLSALKGVEIYVENWVMSSKDIRAGCKCEMYNKQAQLLKGLNG